MRGDTRSMPYLPRVKYIMEFLVPEDVHLTPATTPYAHPPSRAAQLRTQTPPGYSTDKPLSMNGRHLLVFGLYGRK